MLGRNRTLGGQIGVDVSLMQGLVINSCSLSFGVEVCKEGQQFVREHMNAPTVAGSFWYVSSHCLLRHCLWVLKQWCLCEASSTQEAPAMFLCQTRGNLFG